MNGFLLVGRRGQCVLVCQISARLLNEALYVLLMFQRMNLVVSPGLPMMIAGSCSPCVIVSVSSIGVTDTAEKNKEHSAKVFEILTRELGLPEDR